MESVNQEPEKNLNQVEEEATSVEREVAAEDSSDLTAEIENLKDQLLRTMAELENVRKRTEREKEDVRKYAISGFCKDLLGVWDTLDRALESISEQERESNSNLKNLCEGISLTRNEMSKAFSKHHVHQIYPQGEKFDPNFHQAVVEVEAPDSEPGMVVTVLQSGYVIEDRLLRPAMVTVSKK